MRRTLLVAAMCGALGSWTTTERISGSGREANAQARFAATSIGEPRAEEAGKPPSSPDSARDSQAPTSPKRHEKPRRKKSLEIGIGEDASKYGRKMLA